jgi:hypothetical protein
MKRNLSLFVVCIIVQLPYPPDSCGNSQVLIDGLAGVLAVHLTQPIMLLPPPLLPLPLPTQPELEYERGNAYFLWSYQIAASPLRTEELC